jgi:hypothetical protein
VIVKLCMIVVVIIVIIIWVGCMGSNCAVFWERSCFSWWRCTYYHPKCELWNVSNVIFLFFVIFCVENYTWESIDFFLF